MPGRFLIPHEAAKTMAVYKLSFLGSSASQVSARESKNNYAFRNAFMGRRFDNADYRKAAQAQSISSGTSTSSLEASKMEHFAAISEDVEMRSNESVFTASSASSNTISDDDASLMEFVLSRASTSTDDVFAAGTSSLAQPARHSTACCSDLAFRRELRKQFHVEPMVDEAGQRQRRDSTSSFTLGSSFRRELDKEDRVESLALWEETADHKPVPSTAREVAAPNAVPHSWHAGDTAASVSGSSARSRGLDAILRKKRSSFLNGIFSGLSFSSARKSRKSLG